MNILRGFQVIDRDGGYMVSSTYNVVDDTMGNLLKQNKKCSFYAVDEELKSHIEAIKKHIAERLVD